MKNVLKTCYDPSQERSKKLKNALKKSFSKKKQVKKCPENALRSF